ncbi:hypothetical protein NIES4071_78770 [Calothrix sp. NIES-4071]|nr:hypothetical protein NIES4071_78770 [Calothrix sp. NIES-4071]BAZ62149.1 hypothetical protein NIES4105_78700 [Calothrix sp. NIES-4105]
MKAVIQYFYSLFDRELAPTALKVAVIVGTILFVINHGWALLNGEMNRGRWISAGLTYIVPYLVNVHGQYISRAKLKIKK